MEKREIKIGERVSDNVYNADFLQHEAAVELAFDFSLSSK